MAHLSLGKTGHRPWPIPSGAWTWRQDWRDLLFAHWPVSSSSLRPLVPPQLAIREFSGTAWIGIVPFRMGATLRPFPFIPFLSRFPELNVRTYVEKDGKPGVWFLSLDADSLPAVWAARRFYHLPYHKSSMRVSAAGGWTSLESARPCPSGLVCFKGRYRPTSDHHEAAPGSIDHFFAENYCLYCQAPRGALHSIDIHHFPWPLQAAEAELEPLNLVEAFGISLPGPPAHLHYSAGVEVVAWPMRPA
ncbi:MAG: YqjF family protein [Planctomycetota bacterium]